MNFFSLFSKNKSSSSTPKKKSENLLSKMIDQDSILQEKLEKLEKEKNIRTLNLLEVEQKIQECEENKFRKHQNKNNDKLIQQLLTDDKTTNQLVSSNQNDSIQKSKDRLRYLEEVEKTSKELINNTLNFNRLFKMDFFEKYSKCNSIIHIKFDDKLKVRNDNEFALKLEQIIEQVNIQRCILVNKVSNKDLSEMEKLNNLLNTSNCYRQVLKEQLKSMYNQLKYLTASELQRQNSQLNKQLNNLSIERITLTQLLVDFIDKKKQNQKRLLLELEAQNVELETTTKWLLNYSKLVNDMPSELTFSKNTINPMLLHRVCSAGGSHLLLFILENDLKLPLTKQYLTNMGVCNQEDQDILIKTLNNPSENEFFPSAPLENEFSPSPPFIEELECIVCMETPFDVLFIPCGHLCCCLKCSEKINLCPMCRADILNKFGVKNIF